MMGTVAGSRRAASAGKDRMPHNTDESTVVLEVHYYDVLHGSFRAK